MTHGGNMKMFSLLLSFVLLLNVGLLAQNYQMEFQSPTGMTISTPNFMPDITNFDRSLGWDFEGDGVPDIVIHGNSGPGTIYVYGGADYSLKWEYDPLAYSYVYFLGFYDVDADANREALIYDLLTGIHFVDPLTDITEFSLSGGEQPRAIMDYDNDGYPELLVENANSEVIQLWGAGPVGIGSKPGTVTVPRAYELSQNFPNPFTTSTTISFILPNAEGLGQSVKNMELKIYDVTGRMIKSFLLPAAYSLLPGEITWDGRDERGKEVPSGLYFYTLKTGNRKITKNIIKLK